MAVKYKRFNKADRKRIYKLKILGDVIGIKIDSKIKYSKWHNEKWNGWLSACLEVETEELKKKLADANKQSKSEWRQP